MNDESTIDLDQFLKTCGVPTGGQAKVLVQSGQVLVNGDIETRRRRKLKIGDKVAFQGSVYSVALNDDEDEETEEPGEAG